MKFRQNNPKIRCSFVFSKFQFKIWSIAEHCDRNYQCHTSLEIWFWKSSEYAPHDYLIWTQHWEEFPNVVCSTIVHRLKNSSVIAQNTKKSVLYLQNHVICLQNRVLLKVFGNFQILCLSLQDAWSILYYKIFFHYGDLPFQIYKNLNLW